MPKYKAKSKIWIAHENRMVEAGEIFETTFPKVGGKEMRLSDNLELIKPPKPVKPVKPAAKNQEPDSDLLPEDNNTGDNVGDDAGDNPDNAGDNTGDEEGRQ